MPHFPRFAVIAASALLLAGCGIAAGDEQVTLHVLAASSLTDAFAELGAAYHTTHKNVAVRFGFAGSQEAAAEVADREPADVLATADRATMDAVADKVYGPRAFATTTMTIAVAPGNPERIHGPADLADSRLRVVLGGPDVPAGRYARQVLARTGVTVRPRSEEADSRTVLTRIRTRVADAGIVYLTDMRSAGVAAASVPIPLRQNVTATFFAATVRRSGHRAAADAFVAWLLTPEATTLLRTHGFTTP